MYGFRGDVYLEVDTTAVSLPGFGPRLHRTLGDFVALEPHARDCHAGWRRPSSWGERRIGSSGSQDGASVGLRDTCGQGRVP